MQPSCSDLHTRAACVSHAKDRADVQHTTEPRARWETEQLSGAGSGIMASRHGAACQSDSVCEYLSVTQVHHSTVMHVLYGQG